MSTTVQTGITREIASSEGTFTHLGGGRLVVLEAEGRDRGRWIDLGEKPATIGSSSECALVLEDRTVSRQHAEAQLDGTELIVRDLDSRNGTHFEGARIREIRIGYGATFRCGHTTIKFVPSEEAFKFEASATTAFGSIVGQSVPMRRLFSLMSEVASHNVTVLVEGETGTGKELVAEELHKHSARSGGPFIIFDCGAVPPDLVASSLFGHVKGAFTGAVADKRGAFAEADGGTLLLDEVGELPLEVQPALLRALDKKSVCRVGSSRHETFDVRIVATTNRNLREAVALKTFREDLYYRLAVVRIALPPLRERADDIPLLVASMVRRFAEGRNLRVPSAVMQKMLAFPWPGNIRELRNTLERACVLAKDGQISFDPVSGDAQATASPDAPPQSDPGGILPFKEAKAQVVGQFERQYLIELMTKNEGNLVRAAREARIDRKYLRELLDKFGIDIPKR